MSASLSLAVFARQAMRKEAGQWEIMKQKPYVWPARLQRRGLCEISMLSTLTARILRRKNFQKEAA